MRRAPAVLVAVLALAVTAALLQVEVNGTIAKPALAAAEQEQGSQPAKDGGDDGGGIPIWAGIGLMLLAAVAGSTAARARNRRRMRDYMSGD